MGREDIGPNRDGSLGERVSGGLPLASVEGLDSSQDGKADNHGRENQKEKLLLTHVSGFLVKKSVLQKASAPKGRFQPTPSGPTGPTPWFLDASPLFGACHTALPFLAEQPAEPTPVPHLLRRNGAEG